MTKLTSFTQTGPGRRTRQAVQTVGKPHPHTEIKIIDPATGEIVPRGMPGEQCTRGYLVMLGYCDEPA